jgi:hypothetical protein
MLAGLFSFFSINITTNYMNASNPIENTSLFLMLKSLALKIFSFLKQTLSKQKKTYIGFEPLFCFK